MSSRPSRRPETPDLAQRLLTGLERIGVVLRSQAWTRHGARGLTPTQGHILALLAARSAEPVRPSDVARALAVSAPTASDAVAALERKGLVTRASVPGDRRSSRLKLTRKGGAAARKVGQPDSAALAAVRDLPESEQLLLLSGLVRLLASLETAGRLPSTRVCPGCANFQPDVAPGSSAPHRCALRDVRLAEGDVRFDCPSHVPASSG